MICQGKGTRHGQDQHTIQDSLLTPPPHTHTIPDTHSNTPHHTHTTPADNGIGKEGARDLAIALQNNGTLAHLDLSCELRWGVGVEGGAGLSVMKVTAFEIVSQNDSGDRFIKI